MKTRNSNGFGSYIQPSKNRLERQDKIEDRPVASADPSCQGKSLWWTSK